MAAREEMVVGGAPSNHLLIDWYFEMGKMISTVDMRRGGKDEMSTEEEVEKESDGDRWVDSEMKACLVHQDQTEVVV